MEDYSNLSKADRDNENSTLINEGYEPKDPFGFRGAKLLYKKWLKMNIYQKKKPLNRA